MSSQDEPAPVESRGHKRDADDAKLDEVHSANNWENANLGDDERHQKFLRLMGACKKEHKGRFVIGDKNSRIDRTQDADTLINKNLESQYNVGLDLKLSGAARHHTGLGFKEDKEESTSTGETSAPVPEKSKEEDQEKPTKETEKTDPEKGQANGGEQTGATASEECSDEKGKMNFVKASS